MKANLISTIVMFGLLVGCDQSNHNIEAVNKLDEKTLESSVTIDSPNEQYDDTPAGFKDFTRHELKDTLMADFNGDGNLDKAVYIRDGNKSGIIIFHGETNEITKIGFGKAFAHITDFDWIDGWGIVKDKSTYEIIIIDGDVADQTEVNLENPSIYIWENESGGGIITFKNGEYVWIHQNC